MHGCDTLIATPKATRDGIALFAKNSDREPNEAHRIVSIPAADHPSQSNVKCTYIEIPQAAHTFAVLLAKPFWIWGAEMGANEKGLVIGNEAVFTKLPYDKNPGLIGMDLLRLALERAETAREAVDVITDLLARWGQGGNCGYRHKLYYHNSFLMADPQEAWVLETAGKEWAAKKVSDVYAISNGLTIEGEWNLASDNLVSLAAEKGWCKDPRNFSFSKCYSDFLYTHFSDCRRRRQRSMELLSARQGKVTVDTMFRILRDHGGQDDWRPDRGLSGATVCMHAAFGPIRVSQTTGSMVSYLLPDGPVHFVTGTAAPCTSLFKPVWLDAPLPDMGPPPNGTYDAETLFWRHESLHRTLLRDSTLYHAYQNERDALEQQFVREALALASASRDQRAEFSKQCFQKADQFEKEWLARLSSSSPKDRTRFLYKITWKNWNKKARMPEPGVAHE